jgi:hypothetical protein
MPTFTYTSTNYPFGVFSKIRSTDTNQMFSDLSTFFNTTKLDHSNVQAHGLTRIGSSSNIATSGAYAVMVNDANGDIADLAASANTAVQFDTSGHPVAAVLPLLAGGTGAALTNTSNPGDVLQVNAGGTAITLGVATGVSASLRIFQYYNLI